MFRQLNALVLLAAIDAASSAPKSSTSWMRSIGKRAANSAPKTPTTASAWAWWIDEVAAVQPCPSKPQ